MQIRNDTDIEEYMLLKREDITISEKIIRRIMNEEWLIVKVKKAGKYNSYAGKITPAVPNIIDRDFLRKLQTPNG